MDFIPCTLKRLPQEQQIPAAHRAISLNPANRPPLRGLVAILEALLVPEPKITPTPEHLALLTTKYWGSAGVKLTVSFPFDSPAADLKNRILSHMNAWSEYCNISFVLTNGQADVRISRGESGYWSYLGTDIRSIPQNQPTTNFQGFTMQTEEAEYRRVVHHEAGHLAGFPHEHMRPEIVNLLDPNKTILYFMQTQGWTAAQVRQQVLTPLSEASIMGTPNADQDSIMTYHLPASITKNGQPIRGGVDIDTLDQAFSAKVYPKEIVPPPPPPPPTENGKLKVTMAPNQLSATIEIV